MALGYQPSSHLSGHFSDFAPSPVTFGYLGQVMFFGYDAMPLISSMPSMGGPVFARAPKSRIGGSGTTASPVTAPHLNERCDPFCSPSYLQSVLPFFRSLAAVYFWAFGMLVWQALGKCSGRANRFSKRLCIPTMSGVLLALGCATPDKPVLNWQVHSTDRSRRMRPHHLSCPSACSFCRFLGFLLGFSSLPVQVWAAPNPQLRTALGRLYLPDPTCRVVPAPLDPTPVCTSISEAPLASGPCNEQSAEAISCLISRIAPPLPGSTPNYSDLSVLGVTVYAPFFAPTFFGLRATGIMGLEDVLSAVRTIGHMPSQHLDVLIPITRQRFDCSLGLLAFPSFLLQVSPAMCPVILDLTRVGGHYHADSIPCNLSRQEFLEHIATLIWYLEDEIEVWLDAAHAPASPGILAYAPGSVFTVLLRGIGPLRTYDVTEVFSSQAQWGPFEHSPSPRASMGSAVVDTREAAYLPVSMLSPLWPDQDVRRALQLAPTDCTVVSEFHVRLDIHGKQCHTVFAGPANESPWLLDFRPLGFQMRVVYSQQEPSLCTILEALHGIDIGDQTICVGRVRTNTSAGVYLPWLVVQAAPHEATDVPVVCEPPVDLLPEQTCYSVSRQNATLGQAAGDDEVPHAAYKGPSAATPNLQAAVSHAVADANVAMLPAPFHRIGDIPPEHPHHQAATEDDDDEAETVLDAVFLIFSQDTTAEQVRLRLTIPCSVDDALLALAESCDHDKYLRFPDHTPARPQPSQWWIAVIAQPAWASEEPTVLLNLSSVDGRCFVASAPHFFSRSQIFRLAGLTDDGSFEVFPFTAHEPMTAEDEVRLIPCGTVTICRAGGRRVIHGNFIENMLLSGTMWDADPALPSPPAGERSLLIHGHGSGVIHPRSGTVPPTADEVAALCGASSSTIRLTTANLAAPDVLSQGYLCQHLFGVSFTEDNLLAAGDAHNYVAFIDCRALLQGWSMETSQDGRLSHEEMTNWMDTFAPHNWQPQIEGAPIEAGFLVVPHGAVLTASYVPVSSSESQAPSEPVQTDAEGEDEDSEGSPDPSRSSSNLVASGEGQPGRSQGPDDGSQADHGPRTASRSRSRTRSDRIPTNGSDLAAGSLTVGALILTSQAPVADAHCLLSSAQTVGFLSPDLTWSLGCVFLLGLMLSIGLHEILFRRPFLFDRPNICHASFGSCEHKISAEPQGGSEQDQTRLDELRSITRQMGGHWPVRLPPSDQEESPPDPDAEEDPDGFGQGPDIPIQASCVVLKQDFIPEVLIVPINLPCTPAEVLTSVQHSREPSIRAAFPLLYAVTPQPCPGYVACVGVPAWEPGCCVCIDTMAIDRRLFAAFAPEYALRRDFFRLADLPNDFDFEVWLEHNEVPLGEDDYVHVLPGSLIRFLPCEARPDAAPPIGQLLLSPRWWQAATDIPIPSIERAYCLVCGSQARLYVADYSVPTRFRQDIAAITGVCQERLRLFPAQPRLFDVSLSGVPCCTVIAVGELPLSVQHRSCNFVLLDCRRLCEGWKVACAWDGWLDASGVLNDLDDLRPRGWQLRFAGAHEHTEFLSTSPGQILTLILVPAQVLANQGQGNPSQLPVGDDAPLGPEHQPAGAGNGHVAYPDGEHVTGHDDGGGDEGTEGSDVPAPTNLHFALLTPEYTPEYLSIPSELPVPLPRILVLIAHARDPGRKRIFPRLLPVRVQPALTYASVLALPDWDYEGVSVAIACDLPQFRIFADIVPSHLVRDEVLRLAGLDEDAHVAVFLNDIPWAYQGAARLYVVDGDLIRICSLMHQVVPPIEFTRLFDTAEGWHDEPELPGPFDDCFWLLSDQWPRRFRVGIEPRLPIATALAESLGTAEGDLVVAPATGPVRDHAHSGFPSRQIMLAVQLELEGDVPFVLDQRPLLLGMQWAFARAGRVDVQTLCQCHQRRCPPGYFLRVIGGFAAGDIGNHFRFVYPGQLIVVEYWPRRFSPGHHFDDRPPPDDGDDDDADRPPDPENDSTSDVQGQSAASSSSRPDAGTGSTQQGSGYHGRTLSSGLPTTPFCPEANKWGLGFMQEAYTVGSLFPTSGRHQWLLLGLTALVCCWIRVYFDGLAIGPPSFGYDTPFHALHRAPTVDCFHLVLAGICLVCLDTRRRLGACSRGLRKQARPRYSRASSCLFRVGLYALVISSLLCTAEAGRSKPAPASSANRCHSEVPSLASSRLRALPTPLRSRHVHAQPTSRSDLPSGDQGLHVVLTEPLRTLLEDSVAAQESEAMFLAATLLETLIEYFGLACTSACSRSRTNVVGDRGSDCNSCLRHDREGPVLCLAELVAPPLPTSAGHASAPQVFDLDSRQCLLPGSDTRLRELFRPAAVTSLQGPPRAVGIPYVCQKWMLGSCIGRSPAPNEILVLTSDGSFSSSNLNLGWGVVCSLATGLNDLPGQLVGCLCGDIHSFFAEELVTGVCRDAYTAEVSGLIGCAMLVLQLRVCCPIVIRADNVSALDGTQGACQMRDDVLCKAARCLHAAAAQCASSTIKYSHVEGHVGEVANELADALAKHGATGGQATSPLYLRAFSTTEDMSFLKWLPHVCFTQSRAREVPQLHDQVLSWSRTPGICAHPPSFAMQPFMRAFSAPEQHSLPGSAIQYHSWTIVSFNALSLREGDAVREASQGLHGMTGRPSLLKTSLEDACVHVAGIQECRTPKGTLQCGSYTRFSSGADDRSCFGVELWIHEASPCPPSSIVLLHSSPTVLIASGRLEGQALRFVVAHGPHRAHASSVKQEWWKRLNHLCHSFDGNGAWIMMLDANCRVGSSTSNAIGDWQADPEDESGQLFHKLLLELDAWLPATFCHTMFGSGGTLRQKRSGEFDRSDFVAVPSIWRSCTCQAWVEPHISAGHVLVDHLASILTLEVSLQRRNKAASRAKRIDVAALADPANDAVVGQIIQTAPRPDWVVDASEHAALLVDHLYRGLSTTFPVQCKRMRKGYLSEQSEALHRIVASLRHSVRERKAAHRLAFIRCAWLAWRSAVEPFHTFFCGRWLLQLEVRTGLGCMLLRRYGVALRRSCREDRNQMYANLAADVAAASPAELHTAVKRVLRPRKFRKAGLDPLPVLYKANGEQCGSAAEVTDTWREHFRVLEGGSVTTPDSLLSACRERQNSFEGIDQIDAADLPAWIDLEASFRRMSGRKAAGPDLLPPMLCRRFSPQLTTVFWPLLLKTMC